MGLAKSKASTQKSAIEQGESIQFPDGESPLEIWMRQGDKVTTVIKQNRIDLANTFRSLIGVE